MPLTVRVQSLLVQASTDSEAAVVPASVVPLPAFSLQASALLVADVAQARASPPLEASVAVGDRSEAPLVEPVAPAVAEDGWLRAD